MMRVPGDPPSQAEKTQDVLVQLAFTLGLFVLLSLALCTVHKYRPLERVYFPSDVNHKRIKTPAFFGWIHEVWNSTMEHVLQECGADGALIFCVIEMAIQFFAVVAFLGIAVIFPLHAMYGVPKDQQRTELFTIDNIPSGSNVLFAHLVTTWVITFVFYALLYRTYTRVLSIKNRYMLLTGPSSRAIIVEGISSDLTENDLTAYFASLSIGRVEKVVIVRENTKLEHALADRWRWVQRIELLAVRNLDIARQLLSEASGTAHPVPPEPPYGVQNTRTFANSVQPDTPGNAEQALLTGVRVARPPKTFLEKIQHNWRWAVMTPEQRLVHAHARFMDADARVRGLRADFDRHARRTGTANVIFSHPVSESIALQALVHGSMTELRIVPAPSPPEIQFHNLGNTPTITLLRSVAVAVAIFFLIFFWAVPIGAIASLLSLEELVKIFPWLEHVVKWSPIVGGIIKGVLPTLAVTIFLSLLPLLLDVLSRVRGFNSLADGNCFVFSTYFYFLLFNVLLVFSIAGTVFKALQDIIDSPSKIPELLGRSLPRVSPFFVNLVMLHAFVLLPVLLLQIGNVFVSGLLYQPYTPRDRIVACRRQKWAFYEFAPTILIFIIGMVYSLVCPVILPLTLAYSCLAWFVWRYRLLYQVRVGETHGRIWVSVVRMLHYGLTIFVLLMMGILSLKKFYWSAVGLIPLLGVIALGWMWVTQMERRVLNVPLDVWRAWQGDTVDEECDAVHGECQGIYGIERLAADRGYENPMAFGDLPQPWLPGAVPSHRCSSHSHPPVGTETEATLDQPGASSSQFPGNFKDPQSPAPANEPGYLAASSHAAATSPTTYTFS